MPDNLTPALRQVKQAAQRFVDEVVLPKTNQLEDHNDIPPKLLKAVRKASKQQGFYQKTQPKAYGGQPAGALELTLLRETFTAANSPLTKAIFGPGPGILHSAEGQLKTDYLEPLLKGEKQTAFAFTEPDDAPRPTWAIMKANELIINGQKSYVTNGDQADFISALLNIEKDNTKIGTAMVVIDRQTPGLTIEHRFESIDGSTHVAIKFDNVRIPLTQMVGEPGEGMPRALAAIGNVRLMVSAQAMGMCLWTIDHITQHLKAPHRSGKPLGEREGVRLRFADLCIEAYAARSALYRTARLVDRGDTAANEVMATKVLCTEAAGNIVDMGVQLAGGQALVRGHPLERLYRQARSLRLVEGASDLLRLKIAEGLLS